MNILLYKNTSDNNVVNKNLLNEKSVEVTLKDNCSLINPIFILNGTLTDYNYLYCQKFNRYYYITNIEYIRNQSIITCKSDVLKSQNLNYVKGILTKNEKKYNRYINDSNFKTYAYNRTQTKSFPNGFSDNINYILIVSG